MRPIGTRDRKELYDEILDLLKVHPEGLISAQISKELKENDATVRNYLKDLIAQDRVITKKEWNARRLYFFNPRQYKISKDE